jgi:TPR repeat protein
MQWLQLAADQGDGLAWYNLGALYQEGADQAPDYQRALHCYRQAAQGGQPDAQAALGWLYANGMGVLQDYVRAHMWFNVGAVGGHTPAASGREFVAQQMTPGQIAQAQTMARTCIEQRFAGFD